MRLILQELDSLEMFTDPYGSINDIQAQWFSKIVEKYSDYPADFVITYLN